MAHVAVEMGISAPVCKQVGQPISPMLWWVFVGISVVFRARALFAAHGIDRIERIVTDNGSCYRASQRH